MDTNKMREQFEAWWEENKHFMLGTRKVSKGDCFHIWQASREAAVVELGTPSHWVADYSACGGGLVVFDAEMATKVTDPMCSKTPAYTIHALEKAGLKVAP